MEDIEVISRKDFDSLEIWEQVDMINRHIKRGISFNKFCKENKLPESTIRTRLKVNSFVRNKEGLFLMEVLTSQISVEDIKTTTPATQEATTIQQEALSLDILLHRIENIEKELEALRSQNRGIDEGGEGTTFTPYQSDEAVHQLTTRIHLEIYNKLNKFYEQNKLINRQVLFNTLLNDALDRYLK